MKYSILLLFTIVMVFSCTDKKAGNSHEDLMQAVMTVHDEVMPKMGDIMKYKKQIDEKIQALQAAGADANQDVINKLQKVSDDLDASHVQMMDWMHEFNSDFEGMKEDDVIKYLNDQKTKIEQVGQQTEAALKEAIASLQ
ncbi:MAG: hypothetical protein U5K79_04635 [Cyclobacteriaceae bacterium]|nr:hypothetical protein [Cyclobacteriaceae bacterium]